MNIRSLPNLIKLLDTSNNYNILKYYKGNDWKQHINYKGINCNKIQIVQRKNFELMLICWNKNNTLYFNNCKLKVLEGKLYGDIFNNNIIKSGQSYNQFKIHTKDNTATSIHLELIDNFKK